METHANKFTRRISLYIAVIAVIILLTYIADVAAGQGKTGFLPLSASQRGIIFGMSSIILFFVAIGVGIKEKSKLTGAVVIVGGAIMGTSVLVGSAASEAGLMAISSSFVSVVIVGYVILGLGVFMITRKK
jgi:hypothetical protein